MCPRHVPRSVLTMFPEVSSPCSQKYLRHVPRSVFAMFPGVSSPCSQECLRHVPIFFPMFPDVSSPCSQMCLLHVPRSFAMFPEASPCPHILHPFLELSFSCRLPVFSPSAPFSVLSRPTL